MIADSTIEGTAVMLDNSLEAGFITALESYRARQLYTMLKEQQPERFTRMKKEGTLTGYLNKTSWHYYLMTEALMEQGSTIPQAEEMAWLDLMERAGL